MYIQYSTTQTEIEQQIAKVVYELNHNQSLSVYDREALHTELNYLESFLPRESW